MILMLVAVYNDGGREKIDEDFIGERAGMSSSTAQIFIMDLITKGLLTFITVQKKGSEYNHHSLSAKMIADLQREIKNL